MRDLEGVEEAGDGRLEGFAVGELVRGQLELGVALEREGREEEEGVYSI